MTRKRSDSQVWYRAPVVYGLPEEARVDRDQAAIFGYSVMELGPARGHGEDVDEVTLDEVVRIAPPNMGLKMRFNHPNGSSGSLGDYAGRARNYRRQDGRVVGDAFFGAAAFENNADMVAHVLTRAETDPESFGTSLVMKRDLEYLRNEDGTRMKGDDGEPLSPLIRPTELEASDFVDKGAATSAIFEGTGVQLSAEMTEILDEILDGREPESELSAYSMQLLDQILRRPDSENRVRAFLDRYFHNRTRTTNRPKREEPMDPQKDDGEKTLRSTLLDFLGYSGKDTPSAPPQPEGEAIEAKTSLETDKAGADESAVLLELKAQREELAALRQQMAADEATRAENAGKSALSAFKERVDALVDAGKATETGRKALLSLGATYIAAGNDPAELLEPYENMPSIEAQADLTGQVTFTPPDGAEAQNMDVDLSYFSSPGPEGRATIKPEVRERALLGLQAVAGAPPGQGMAALERLYKQIGFQPRSGRS